MRVESRSIALAAALATSACFSPDVSDGQFSCGDGELCPPGFACGPAGVCVGDADAPIDAAPRPDARIDAAPPPDAASPPDAAPPQVARVYTVAQGADTWSVEDASAFFAGTAAPDPADIGAAFSHCGGGANVLCVSTPTAWVCTDNGGGSWFDNAWSATAAPLDGAAPTFLELWLFPQSPSGRNQAWISAGNLWWVFDYSMQPIRFLSGFWSIDLVVDYDDLGTYSDMWAGEANAPPDPLRIVADTLDDSGALIWRLWDDSGVEYKYDYDADAWMPSEPAALLALPDAPPPSLIAGATRCGTTTFVFTRAGVP